VPACTSETLLNFQELVTTGFGTRAWLALGRLPPRAGYAFARWLTLRLYHHKSGVIYRVIYANQKQVLGPSATHEQADAAVAAVLHHAGMANYDMARVLAQGKQAILNSIDMGTEVWSHIATLRAAGQGVLVCGAHLSNFNLGFLSFAIQGDFPIQVLSTAMPARGFGIVSDLRNRGTMEDTPIDAPALKKAIGRLRTGGAAIIGIDWPIPGTDDGICFFGAPSLLPSGYIRLALSGNAALLPLSCRWTPDRGYYALSCPPIELERSGDRERDVQHNTRRVLAIVENWIRETPEQWLMYHPVWSSEDVS